MHEHLGLLNLCRAHRAGTLQKLLELTLISALRGSKGCRCGLGCLRQAGGRNLHGSLLRGGGNSVLTIAHQEVRRLIRRVQALVRRVVHPTCGEDDLRGQVLTHRILQRNINLNAPLAVLLLAGGPVLGCVLKTVTLGDFLNAGAQGHGNLCGTRSGAAATNLHALSGTNNVGTLSNNRPLVAAHALRLPTGLFSDFLNGGTLTETGLNIARTVGALSAQTAGGLNTASLGDARAQVRVNRQQEAGAVSRLKHQIFAVIVNANQTQFKHENLHR